MERKAEAKAVEEARRAAEKAEEMRNPRPYAAWGLKDDQMSVRVAAADFVVLLLRLNPFVVDAEAAATVEMVERGERRTSTVRDGLVSRLVKLIKRNRTEVQGDAQEKAACERVARIAYLLAQRSALRDHAEFQAAVKYIVAGVKATRGKGNPALLKLYWDRMQAENEERPGEDAMGATGASY